MKSQGSHMYDKYGFLVFRKMMGVEWFFYLLWRFFWTKRIWAKRLHSYSTGFLKLLLKHCLSNNYTQLPSPDGSTITKQFNWWKSQTREWSGFFIVFLCLTSLLLPPASCFVFPYFDFYFTHTSPPLGKSGRHKKSKMPSTPGLRLMSFTKYSLIPTKSLAVVA